MAFINKKICVIGGGSGIYNLLLALKSYPVQLSAIISTLDNGGSTGIIRKEYDTIAVGDLRRSVIGISSLREDFKEIFAHRFNSGFLKGHSLGNLIILAALQQGKDINRVFQVRGKVIPVTLDKSHLFARLENNQIIEGETNIDVPKHDPNLKIKEVFIKPKAKANSEAVRALKEADAIILGPGDFYTSIIPNLLVDGIGGAIRKSKAKKIFICNSETKIGETNGFFPADFVLTMEKYLGKNCLDYVTLLDKKLASKINPNHYDLKKLVKSIMKFLENISARQESPVLVLDFDDTLFNTHRLKLMHPDYKDNPENTYYLDYQSFIFPDTIKFLKENRYKKYVLSHALKQYLSYQKTKISKSNLENYFEKIYITEEPEKVSAMRKIAEKHPYSPIFFIDDKIATLEAVKKSFPQITTVRIKRFDHQEINKSSYIDLETKNLSGFSGKVF